MSFHRIEPPISQLMEDLEQLNREKESLTSDKEIAEEKYHQATDMAKQQKATSIVDILC